eukprot:g9737.t1
METPTGSAVRQRGLHLIGFPNHKHPACASRYHCGSSQMRKLQTLALITPQLAASQGALGLKLTQDGVTVASVDEGGLADQWNALHSSKIAPGVEELQEAKTLKLDLWKPRMRKEVKVLPRNVLGAEPVLLLQQRIDVEEKRREEAIEQLTSFMTEAITTVSNRMEELALTHLKSQQQQDSAMQGLTQRLIEVQESLDACKADVQDCAGQMSGGGREDLTLHASKYGVAVSWDLGRTAVDLDLQAVVVDEKGSIIDAVYYNNMKALRGSITHSGDEQTGKKAGLDEFIWVNLSRLPESIRLVIFVVAAFSGGSLRDAQNGMLHILEEDMKHEVGRYQLEQSLHQVDAVAVMQRFESDWRLRVIEEPAREGQQLKGPKRIQNIIRAAIPGAPKRQKVAFAMEKAAVVDLFGTLIAAIGSISCFNFIRPQAYSLSKVYAGLGWDASSTLDIDLDVSAVVLTKEYQVLGAVFFGQLEGWALKHSGDNLTGEVIEVDLRSIPAEVAQIFFVVNVYTRGITFESIQRAYCRIFDAAGEEMARYVLHDGRGECGLIMGRFFHEFSGDAARWGFQALGSFCKGQTWKDSVPAIAALARQSPKQLQMRSGTISIDGPGGRPAPVKAMPTIQEPPRSSACAVL